MNDRLRFCLIESGDGMGEVAEYARLAGVRNVAAVLATLAMATVVALSPSAGEAARTRNLEAIANSPSVKAANVGPARSRQVGVASVYSDRFDGRRTASGEIYDRDALTAAHKTLPFGTQVKVTNVKNGKFVMVRINDRGRLPKGRLLDLSGQAAKALGVRSRSLSKVRIEVIGGTPHGTG